MAKARIAFMIALTGGLSAAVEPLKLEDYVPADYHRQFLSVSPGFAFNGYDTEREEDSSWQEIGNTLPSARLQLNHGAHRFTQYRRWKIECGSIISAEGDEYRSEDSRNPPAVTAYSDHRDNSVFRYSAYTRLGAQQYLGGRFFLAPSGSLDWDHTPSADGKTIAWSIYPSLNGSDSNQFSRHRSETEYDRFRVSGNAKVEAGFGRIQDVGFAELGLYMLDRIAETTGKPLALDAQGMHDLEAAVEARRKQRPFLDYRAASVYDLETVALFLEERRGGEALPARAILAMADEWHHHSHDRTSGWEVKAYPFMEWAWDQNDRTEDAWNSSKVLPASSAADPDSLARIADAGFTAPKRTLTRQFESRVGAGAGVRADWKRPWRRFWQFNAAAYGKLYRDHREFGDKGRTDSAGASRNVYVRFLDITYPAYDCGASLEAKWYPSSRTSLAAGTGVGIQGTMDYLDSKADQTPLPGPVPERKTLDVSPSISASGNYWVNPRLTASFYAAYGWYWNERQGAVENLMLGGAPINRTSASGSDLRLTAGLRYYLF